MIHLGTPDQILELINRLARFNQVLPGRQAQHQHRPRLSRAAPVGLAIDHDLGITRLSQQLQHARFDSRARQTDLLLACLQRHRRNQNQWKTKPADSRVCHASNPKQAKRHCPAICGLSKPCAVSGNKKRPGSSLTCRSRRPRYHIQGNRLARFRPNCLEDCFVERALQKPWQCRGQ
ncbi:hypothetical protein SDC9_163659 [bioreactor metagenome]|uniref:Uncharacterized protein n=1 Tax=bioreactor metagenome TaxID=1076179 RepID=A0A645FQZ4_9ZZZZ